MIAPTTKTILKASLASIVLSFFIFALRHEWIIIKPWRYTFTQHTDYPQLMTKKTVTFWFWDGNRWHQENQDLLWSPTDVAHNCSYVVSTWLSLLRDEELEAKRTEMQSCLLNQSYAYISFDRNPLPKQKSTYEKLLFIQGLLKTIRESGITLASIQFLVHHQPLNDTHLDFSNPWPLEGFLP